MDRIRGQITTPVLIAAAMSLVLGLIIGLLFGWVVWPVEWVDAGVPELRADLQSDYLAMAVQSFIQTSNIEQAQLRWNEMGPDRDVLLGQMQQNPPPGLAPENVSLFAGAVQANPVIPTPAGGALPGQQPVEEAGSGATNTLVLVLVIMCLLTLVIGGLLAYLFVFRNRRLPMIGNRPMPSVETGIPGGAVQYPEGQDPPIVQFLTTYNLPNELYDDSFSIDSPNGEFLGECGVGIAETVGVGDAKKVTAFEVWLFDKNDIQTVTKVLMSQFAFNDTNITQRLASKGEPVLAEPGKRILLETATLQLEARVVNMNYGQGGAHAAGSFFEQMTLELAVWQK